jgi:hypothetical protein
MVAVFSFFFNAHIFLRADGTGKMALVYPAAPMTNAELERGRFLSATTETTRLDIAGGVVRARVAFRDVTRLTEASEMSQTVIEVGPAVDGRRKVFARLRSPAVPAIHQDQVTATFDRPARIRLTVPGAIIESTAPDVSGRTASWDAPMRKYFAPEGIEIGATYRARAGEPTTMARAAR